MTVSARDTGDRTTVPARAGRTRHLLLLGAVAGPLFTVLVLAQAFTRDGFDPRRHPLSLLSLGDLGGIQVAAFVVCGAMILASAFGLRHVLRPGRGARWIPLLVGAYGASLVWAGVFVTDAALGFPVGAPDDVPAMSWHGMLHAIAPTVMGLAVPAALIVYSRRLAGLGHRGRAAGALAVVAVNLGLTWSSFPAGDYRLLLAGGVVGWLGIAALTAAELRRHPTA